jgi:hypothetical protein
MSLNKSDEIFDKIVEQIRAAGGDVVHPCRRLYYIIYLEEKLSDNGLLTGELQHLLDLYERLQSRDYFCDGRSSTSSAIVNELEGLLNENADHSVAALVGKVFIFHQISEEWLYTLVKACQFLIDLRMGSYRIKQSDPEKQNLHGLCNILERCVYFPSREELIREAREINNIRNRVAHELLQTDSVERLQKLTIKYLDKFASLQSLMEDSFDEVYDTIKDFRKFSDMFENDLLDLLILRLDENKIDYQDEEAFALELKLIL